jgi:hypothetical protein
MNRAMMEELQKCVTQSNLVSEVDDLHVILQESDISFSQ